MNMCFAAAVVFGSLYCCFVEVVGYKIAIVVVSVFDNSCLILAVEVYYMIVIGVAKLYSPPF